MPLQFHPIAIGLMLVVAVGTIAYTLFASGRQTEQPYGSSRSTNDNHSLPPFPRTSSPASSDSSCGSRRKRKECEICYEALQVPFRELGCGHVFHKHCIMTWLLERNYCPTCRAPA